MCKEIKFLLLLVWIIIAYQILCIKHIFKHFFRNRCPCSNNFMYSLVMMVGPALFLLGLGFMMSEGFWQSILKTSRLQHVKERCNHRMKSLTKLFQPFLPPMAYIIIALLHGDFLVCSSLGSFSATCYSDIPDTIISQVR